MLSADYILIFFIANSTVPVPS